MRGRPMAGAAALTVVLVGSVVAAAGSGGGSTSAAALLHSGAQPDASVTAPDLLAALDPTQTAPQYLADGPVPVPATVEPETAAADGVEAVAASVGAGGPDVVPENAALLAKTLTREGIPRIVLDAYTRAAASLARTAPSCHLTWPMIAAIGRTESHHAASGRAVTPDGTLIVPILGPRLDGTRWAAIPDTDGGRLDGDTVWDRAVGPMQFIPSTWRALGADGNGDGVRNPQNIYDAALATGRYLCHGGRNLSDAAQLRAAYFSYNRSAAYVAVVYGSYLTYAGLDPAALGRPTLPTSTEQPQAPVAPAPPPATPAPAPAPPAPEATPATPVTPVPPATPAPAATPTPPATPTPAPPSPKPTKAPGPKASPTPTPK